MEKAFKIINVVITVSFSALALTGITLLIVNLF